MGRRRRGAAHARRDPRRGRAHRPTRTALTYEGRQLSYRALDEDSNRLARLLVSRGVGPESVVALSMPRSIESVASVWAVAKTGTTSAPVLATAHTDATDSMERGIDSAHHRFRADTPGDEQPGQPIRVLVEGAVTSACRPSYVTPSACGVGVGSVCAAAARISASVRGSTPSPPHTPDTVGAPPRRADRCRRRPSTGILEDRVEHAQEPRRQRLDGLRIEHVGRERERRVHTVRDRVP
ncbi:AMP-binding protein, partial [Rhodococcus hoagii]|nr:AMP-binding protein [Prescottella equi]